MKFSVILAFVAAATVVSAAESNAFRFARGMGPLGPARRSSKSNSADGHQPSSVPGGSSACDTGTQQCCDYMGTSGQDSIIDHAIGLHGLTGVISAGSSVGLNCVASETDCTQQPTCCNNVKQKGLINWGCSPVNIG